MMQGPGRRSIVPRLHRFKVVSVGDDYVTCHRYTGTVEGTEAILVATQFTHEAGDEIYALYAPVGGTGVTVDGVRVMWIEVSTGVQVSTPVFVTLSSDGGGAGNLTTQCSWTYTATDLNGDQVGAGVSPSNQRPSIGKMLAATIGVGYYDGTEFVLWMTDELLDTGACS